MSQLIDEQAELRPLGRQITWCLAILYLLAIGYMCFGPQHHIEGVETPGIQYFGRVVVLLMPFNSLVHMGQLSSPREFFWVLGQNFVNILLLFPLVLVMLALFPRIRTWKRVTFLAFAMSACIELTQVIIDILFDANRVFEIDDLWTNTLGGLLALVVYRWLTRILRKNAPA